MPVKDHSSKKQTDTFNEHKSSAPKSSIKPEGNAVNFLRFGESYTSLILGILVVIAATILILGFVRNKNMQNKQPINQQDIAVNTQDEKEGSKTTIATTTPKSINMQDKKNTQDRDDQKDDTIKPLVGKIYTVQEGDNLWDIAEKTYNSGYNWVDIARENKLIDPGKISKGVRLILPNVTPKIATIENVKNNGPTDKVNIPESNQQFAASASRILGDSYLVAKGDTLWTISIRAYGNGFQWKKIAQANNLANPRLIHTGNSIKIPRG